MRKTKKKKMSLAEEFRLWSKFGWAPEGTLIAVSDGKGFFKMQPHRNKGKKMPFLKPSKKKTKNDNWDMV